MLAKLKSAGKKLFVATSKPEPAARKIVKYFQLDSYFEDIGGSTLDGTISRKGDVIDMVVGRIGEEHRKEMIMVGDRKHDVIGAKENRIPCVGVLYGYGNLRELTEAGAASVCLTPEEVSDILS